MKFEKIVLFGEQKILTYINLKTYIKQFLHKKVINVFLKCLILFNEHRCLKLINFVKEVKIQYKTIFLGYSVQKKRINVVGFYFFFYTVFEIAWIYIFKD